MEGAGSLAFNMALTDEDFERIAKARELTISQFGRPFERFHKLFSEVIEIENLVGPAQTIPDSLGHLSGFCKSTLSLLS